MKAAYLKKDPIISDWLKSRKCKKNSVKAYLQGMQEFTELLNMTPTQLLKKAEKEERKNVKMRSRKIKRYILDYTEHLEKKGLAPMTIKNRIAAVKSFYTSFDIQLPTQPRSEHKAKPLQKNLKIPTKEDLQEILKYCDPLEKAIILTGVASGLSVNEIADLKIKDFLDYYDEKTQIATLKLRREKTNYDFITFLTPEASKAIFEYLNYRNREAKEGYSKERRSLQLSKQKVYSKDGYLFICRRIDDRYHETKNEELRKLNERTIMGMYRQVSEDSGRNSEFGAWNLLRTHNLRRLCYSILLNAGADIFFTDFITGHQIDSVKAAYFRADPEKLKEIYKKYIPYLTIQKELNISESPEFQKLKEENQILATEAVRATVERSEIQEIRNELLKIKAEEERKNRIDTEIFANLFMQELPQYFNKSQVEKQITKFRTDPEYSKEYQKFLQEDDAEEVEEDKYKKLLERLLEIK